MRMLHIFSLTYYKKNEVEAGRGYLQAWMPAYDRRSILHGHLSWHEALWALQDGDEIKMWSTIDSSVSLKKEKFTFKRANRHRCYLLSSRTCWI